MTIAAFALLFMGLTAPQPAPARPLVVIDEKDVMRREPTPHGAIGISTAYRISDGIPGRTMEFRKRILHRGGAIGLHRIAHDEVYHVLSGEGVVTSGGQSATIRAGMTAYLYDCETVGIRQTGTADLTILVAYPIKPPPR